ncbi:MAG TPA: GNAT family N-acetyltransferase [Opitutaceae bacterium]|nr:GNAT family N-acetyltransferase [Opitutaceae bacterium]
MPPPLKIRAATRADRPEWARLRQALWPDCRGPRAALEMREQMSRPAKFGVLVIERAGGELVGFIELALRDGVDGAARETTAYVEGWYVEPELRGRGWGRKLIAAGMRWARARGMAELASDAELWNTAAIRAHRAVGFRETFRSVQFIKRVR